MSSNFLDLKSVVLIRTFIYIFIYKINWNFFRFFCLSFEFSKIKFTRHLFKAKFLILTGHIPYLGRCGYNQTYYYYLSTWWNSCKEKKDKSWFYKLHSDLHPARSRFHRVLMVRYVSGDGFNFNKKGRV